MGVYTKKGDAGYTDLYKNGRVPKSDVRIDALGTVDELTSNIGVIRSGIPDQQLQDELLRIQRNLKELMTEIASNFEQQVDLTGEIRFLEGRIDAYAKLYPKIDYFIMPGDAAKAAPMDVARTVARRAERALSKVVSGQETTTAAYLNRLSDYLYTIARKTEFAEKIRGMVEETMQNPVKVQPAHMNLKTAKAIAESVEAEAQRMGLTVVIAVTNKEGNPLLIHRMDDAFSVSFGLARKKAFTAAALKMPTTQLAQLTAAGADFDGLEGMLDEEIVTLGGGFPILANGQIIGAIGVSGSNVANDTYLGEYGSKCLEKE